MLILGPATLVTYALGNFRAFWVLIAFCCRVGKPGRPFPNDLIKQFKCIARDPLSSTPAPCSDILTPLPGIGIPFEIDDAKGPILEQTIRSAEDVRPCATLISRLGAFAPPGLLFLLIIIIQFVLLKLLK